MDQHLIHLDRLYTVVDSIGPISSKAIDLVSIALLLFVLLIPAVWLNIQSSKRIPTALNRPHLGPMKMHGPSRTKALWRT